jgi:hypothetical protein
MPPVLAYFLTWTTYGTWLPGDPRGWVKYGEGGAGVPYRQGEPLRHRAAARLMVKGAVRFGDPERQVVSGNIAATCRAKGWTLLALSVRSNHVHIVLAAPNETPERVMTCLKAWASRALNDGGARQHWWTRHGSTRYISTPASLKRAIEYVNDQ